MLLLFWKKPSILYVDWRTVRKQVTTGEPIIKTLEASRGAFDKQEFLEENLVGSLVPKNAPQKPSSHTLCFRRISRSRKNPSTKSKPQSKKLSLQFQLGFRWPWAIGQSLSAHAIDKGYTDTLAFQEPQHTRRINSSFKYHIHTPLEQNCSLSTKTTFTTFPVVW